MSALMTGLVLKHFDGKGGERMLAFALADKADGNGEDIFPGVKLLCEETKLGRSTVLRLLAKMQADGWLQPIENMGGGRGRLPRYRINPAWIKGLKMRPFSETKPKKPAKRGTSSKGISKGSQNETLYGAVDGVERVSSATRKGPNLRSPPFSPSHSPSYSPSDPSQNPQDARARASEGEQDDPNDQEQLDKLQADYPANTHPGSHWLIGRREASRRIEEGHRWAQLHEGVARMRAQKQALGKIGTDKIHSPKNFFSHPLLLFLDPFPLPVSPAEQRERKALEQLVGRRAAIGIPNFREPLPGETSDQYCTAQNDAWGRSKADPVPATVRESLGKLAGMVIGRRA